MSTDLTKTDKLRGKKLTMIEALRSSLGIVSQACKKIGISRETHYQWLKTSQAYKRAYDDLLEEKRDFVETAFLRLVNEGNVQAVCTAAKLLLKPRGYDEAWKTNSSQLSYRFELIRCDPDVKLDIENKPMVRPQILDKPLTENRETPYEESFSESVEEEEILY